MKLKAGDKVRLNKNIKNFEHGRGGVGYDEIGKITFISEYTHDICVDFPSHHMWAGLEEELVLVNGKKFFKKLPSNFTGTLEVENGYIVEKEILDEVEKGYLSNVIKPFRNRVEYIVKKIFANKEYIRITMKGIGCDIYFPSFEKGTMYKGMEGDKDYTLEELGL